MIGKIGSGGGFGGLTRYLLTGDREAPHPERVLWTSTRELAVDDPGQAALVMRATAAQGQTDKPVQHLSLSLAPGEHLNREQWEQLVDATLRDLGLAHHQALIVAHRDTDHDHVHVMVNRVHPETFRAWDRWQDRPRLMASLRTQERAFGLKPTPHVKDPDRLPDALVQGFERTGEPPLLDYARAVARPLFQEASSWSELHERLAEHGLFLDRKGQGLVLSDDRHAVKASSVHREASLRALERRLGPYETRGPRLADVQRSVRDEYRAQDLNAELAPLYRAHQEVKRAEAAVEHALGRVETVRHAIDRAAEGAYRDPVEAAGRLLALLDKGEDLAGLTPARLGALKGTVLHAGRRALPLGGVGTRAYLQAAETLPRLGAAYREAREQAALAQDRLEGLRQDYQRVETLLRPLLEEGQRLRQAPPKGNVAEQILSLRPRDQVALAREFGAEVVEWAAEQAPRLARRSADSRESWLRNLAPQLDHALDRQLRRAAVQDLRTGQSLATWANKAARQSLRPVHIAQALIRSGASVDHAVQAVSVAFGHPAKKAVTIAAKALGLPALPLRLASMAWSLARTLGRGLSR